MFAQWDADLQNFQHGTLDFHRQSTKGDRVTDGGAVQLPSPSPAGPPFQLERLSPAHNQIR